MNISEYQDFREDKEHTSADFPYNTYPCTIPLDFPAVPVHWHEEAEIIVVKQGRGIITVDLEEFRTEAGEFVLVLPGHLHAIRRDGNSRMEYENILFSPSLLVPKNGDACTVRYLEPFFAGMLPPETVCCTKDLPYCGELWDLISRIDVLCDSRPDGWQLEVKGYLYHFFAVLIRHTKKGPGSGRLPKSLEKMKRIVKYTEEHFSEPMSISDMAELTGYSEAHFMRFFKAYMGRTFTAWLNDYRLSMAARLLGLAQDSVLEIAQQSGFGNLSYFNRLFRKKYGMTPREFRRHSEDMPAGR